MHRFSGRGIEMIKMKFFSTFFFASTVLLCIFVQAPSAEISPLPSALHVFPPVADDPGSRKALDRTLTKFLKVQMCERTSGGGCTMVGESTFHSGLRSSRLRLLGDRYYTIWRPPFDPFNPKDQKEKEFEIHFIVAGLEVGFINYQPNRVRVIVPIQFRIDNHPVLRAQVLHEQGFTGTRVAEVLKDEFSLAAQETAQILNDVGCSSVEVGLALKEVFLKDAREAAQIIKDVGYSEDEILLALMEAYDTYLAIVDVMVSDWESCANVPSDYTGLAWGQTVTVPYIPGLIGTRVWSNDVNKGIGGDYTTIWVKYDLVAVTSNQPVLVDYGVFHWPYWNASCPPGWELCNGTSDGRQCALNTRTWNDCWRIGMCVHYVPMNQTETFMTNAGLSYTGGSEAACPVLGEANLGYWPMQADSLDIHRDCGDGNFMYLCYGRGKAWPPMPMSIDVTDEEKLNFLATYAPRVWLAQNESYWPSPVEWAFPHLVRTPCLDIGVAMVCGTPHPEAQYWLFTKEGVEGSGVLDFFRGCNGYSTSNPCTINDVPIYAYWVKKSTQVDGTLFDYVDLVYFFYYPYNRGKEVANTVWESHVGDWEHVTVRLMWAYDDQTGWSLQPMQVYLSAHDFGAIYEWAEIPKINDTHAIIYSAWGSHGVWLTAGENDYGEVCYVVACEDLTDWTSQGTPWDTWNYLEAFDYNTKQGLGGSTWPLWMSEDFTNPGTCGDPSNPVCGPIYRWGNTENECYSDPIGRCLMTTGPTGPVSKGVWSPGILK